MAYKEPLISVGIPLYNMVDTLDRCLNSVINQTYKNLEIIISDNNSDDGSYDICKKFKKKDSRIILIRQSKIIPMNDNFNFVLNKANGEYFVWQAADDFRNLLCIEKYFKKIKELNTGLIFSAYNNLDDISKQTHLYPGYQLSKDKKLAAKRFIYRPMPCMIYGLYKTELLQKIRKHKLLANTNYDWHDAFTNVLFIYYYGAQIIQSNEVLITFSYKNEYVPKAIKNAFLDPIPYCKRLLSMTKNLGFICLFGSVRVFMVSTYMNFFTLKRLLRKKY